jgi:hypothetical protein
LTDEAIRLAQANLINNGEKLCAGAARSGDAAVRLCVC